MTLQQRRLAAGLLIFLLALPSGLCSLFTTVWGTAMLFERDALADAIGWTMLGGSAIGWAFCALVLYAARHMRRIAARNAHGDATSP